MSRSRSFDRAASYYDQTRPLFDSFATQGIQAILDITGPSARVLDVGTGTGRISIPLLERSLDLVGCDLSAKMLKRLQEKFPAARIIQADAAYLPFPTAQFDFVLTVHVLHLIPYWRDVLREIRRVLAPNGAYLYITTWGSTGASIRERVRVHWRDWLATQGINVRNPGTQDHAEFAQEIQSLGARLTEIEVLRYSLTFTLREELERLASRVYSDAWDVPESLFDASIKDLRTFAEHEYRNLDEQLHDEARFAIEVVKFG
jgi:SAM-dependent methyltransferase